MTDFFFSISKALNYWAYLLNITWSFIISLNYQILLRAHMIFWKQHCRRSVSTLIKPGFTCSCDSLPSARKFFDDVNECTTYLAISNYRRSFYEWLINITMISSIYACSSEVSLFSCHIGTSRRRTCLLNKLWTWYFPFLVSFIITVFVSAFMNFRKCAFKTQ